MAGLDAGDRKLAGGLHGLGWSKRPTPINTPKSGDTVDTFNARGGTLNRVPSNGGTTNTYVRNRTSWDATNPYARGRMADNLRQSNNQTSKRTVLGGMQPRQPKRQKITDAYEGQRGKPLRSLPTFHKGKGEGREGSRAHEWNAGGAEPIEIDDDSEVHLPVRIEHLTGGGQRSESPDPLNLIDQSTPQHPSKQSSHPLEHSSESSLDARTAADGESTKRLQQRINNVVPTSGRRAEDPGGGRSESDEIESFTDEPSTSGHIRQTPGQNSKAGPSVVRRQIAMIEKKVQRAGPEPPTPHIDLNAMSKKNAMKPKSNPIVRGTFGSLNDPLTAPSMFKTSPSATSQASNTRPPKRRSTRNAEKDKTESIRLPLEAWSWGCTVREDDVDISHPRYWLVWDVGLGKIQIRKRGGSPDPFQGELQHELQPKISSWKHTAIPARLDSHLVISLKLYKSAVDKRDRVPKYSPGSPDADSTITFKFVSGYPDTYTVFPKLVIALGRICDRVETLTGGAPAACWEMAKRSVVYSSTSNVPPRPPRANPKQEDIAAMLSNQNVRSRPTRAEKGSPVESDRDPPTTRRSARLNVDSSPSPDPDELMLVYPSSGAGAININQSDLKRLDDGCYLNDTLIEFGLKLWLADLRQKNPTFAEQVYVFSSFFYKKLNVRDKEEGYQSVRKWTSKMDLFQKKYIIIPINEHFHWYLAIICNPEHVLLPALQSVSPPTPLTRKRKRDSEVESLINADVCPQPPSPSGDEIVPDSRPPTPVAPVTVDSGGEEEVENILDQPGSVGDADESRPPSSTGAVDQSDVDMVNIETLSLQYPSSPPPSPMAVDEAVAQPVPQEEVNADGVSAEVFKTVHPSSFYASASVTREDKETADEHMKVEDDREDVGMDDLNSADANNTEKTAHIFIFDSLGTKHPQAIKTLLKYLELEAKDKKGIDQPRLPLGKVAAVPSQPNYCDCGVYVLHFMRTFLGNPEVYTGLILSQKSKGYSTEQRKADWQGDGIRLLRGELRERIQNLSEVWKIERQAKEARKRDASRAPEDQTGAPASGPSESPSDDEVIIAEASTSSKSKTRGQPAKRPT